MLGKLFLLFTIVPLVELYLLFLVGSVLGVLETVLLVMFTAMLGSWLARREGFRVWTEWQRALQEFRVPEEGVAGSLLVLVGGVLLITPGVLTDVFGLLLLIPFTRKVASAMLMRWFERRVQVGDVHVVSTESFAAGFGSDLRNHTRSPRRTGSHPGARGDSSPGSARVIDVEVLDADGADAG